MKVQGMPTIITLMLVVLLSSPGLLPAGQHSQTSTHVLEIRSYNLKPGVRDRFQKRFVEESLPLLMKYKVDVVAYGPSLHDSDSWFLMRSYASIEDRQRSEDIFYGSDEWKKGPREAVMADIESYTTIVIQVDETTLEGFRRLRR
jgi:hypothetical protein